MLWFTSDWHLGHANIIKYSNRPFNNVTEQAQVIFQNFFSKVKNGDTVYFLGDISFGIDPLNEFIRKFKIEYTDVEFHYIEGNHDYKNEGAIKRFATSYHKILDIVWNSQSITLCHYIMYSFNKSHANAWQLYGHHHEAVDTTHLGKRMCMCLEVNNYSPVSIHRIKDWMDKQSNNWDYIKTP